MHIKALIVLAGLTAVAYPEDLNYRARLICENHTASMSWANFPGTFTNHEAFTNPNIQIYFESGWEDCDRVRTGALKWQQEQWARDAARAKVLEDNSLRRLRDTPDWKLVHAAANHK